MAFLLNKLLEKTGQFPSISIKLVPLDTSLFANAKYGVEINNFLSYRFRASVVNPVSDFSFTFANPNQEYPFTKYINEGDIILLFVKVEDTEYPLSTGIIDTIETAVTPAGETVSVMGRDLMGQWADQTVFSPDAQGIWAQQATPTQVFNQLKINTRTQAIRFQGIPSISNYVSMAPMESKLQVVTRFLEPYNSLAWCAQDGTHVWGQPNMSAPNSGVIIMNKNLSLSNCISMRSTRSAATIPNFILPILSNQVDALNQLSKRPGLANPQPGPTRLAKYGHYLHKVFVSSVPNGSDAQPTNSVQLLRLFNGRVLDVASALALRDMARENMRELLIQAVVPGHVNEQGLPFLIDQNYHVIFDRDGVEEDMYLFEVEYSLNESEGPRTLLMFTRKNSIVAGNNFQNPENTQ